MSRIIKAADAERVDRWSSPPVEESAAQALKGAGGAGAHLLTAHQVDALQTSAYKEAETRGFEEGLRRGQAEAAAQARRLEALAAALAQPLDELDVALEDELLTLAKTLAQHILRRELKTDGGQIIGAVRDCLRVLPSAARDVVIHLHPRDAELVRAHAAENSSEQRWRIEEDPSLDLGSLRVTSDSSRIDGRLESRLNEIVSAALTTGRSGDGTR